MKTVLVTGANGYVATGVLPRLQECFNLRLFDKETPKHLLQNTQFVQGDLLDWSALEGALSGVSAVLHLAIAPGHSGTFENDSFNDLRFDVNVKGTYHVLETARRKKVKRVVHVSSAMVTWGHAQHLRSLEMEQKVPGNAPPRPIGTYALTKALSEEITRHYGQEHGMKIMTLRITAPLDVSSSDWKAKPVRHQQIRFHDLAQGNQTSQRPNRPNGRRGQLLAGRSSNPWPKRCLWPLLGNFRRSGERKERRNLEPGLYAVQSGRRQSARASSKQEY